DEYSEKEKPFFLYMAYTAPHYPLHARPEDIDKYRDRYSNGWDALREERYLRMIEMGLLDSDLKMSPQDENAKNWDGVPNKEEWALKMAVYAAMIDRMDQNIGRVLAKIREMGEEENTIVMFLSDNGGCAEEVNLTPDVPPGPVNSYRTVDLEWANAQNTPFRKFKRWDHEGGISTPFIVHYPGVVNGGTFTDQPGHIIDIMATILDISGAEYPATYQGRNVLPLKGKSLLPVFQGKKREEHEMLCWEFNGARAIRKGDWKLVDFKDREWELYDIKKDRTELHNLANQKPEIVKELEGDWIRWARECNVHSKSY
ncbi:sulfatase-like hydrolase/transferase, partial [candidate division KSB1 bacterium]|nr:sulfatase-like hydrolase/transferase [candidate division KSB1 bacterium]